MTRQQNKPDKPHRNIFVITGKIESGKTTFTGELVHALRKRGIDIAGVLCKGQLRDGERSGFTLVNISDGASVLFATVEMKERWPRYGRFFFNPKALITGERIIREAIEQRRELVILDEVGPLELGGSGWSNVLAMLLEHSETLQIWVVREKILGLALKRWNIPEEQVFTAGIDTIDTIIKTLFHEQ